MAAREPLRTVLAGGLDGADPSVEGDPGDPAGAGDTLRDRTVGSIVKRGSVATRTSGDVAADLWPSWALEQLRSAIDLARHVADRGRVAGVLYREWFNPPARGSERRRPMRPLVGIYRNAHAGSTVRTSRDGVQVVGRHDVVAADGWWRTWGEAWTPPRTRPGSVRVLLTPHPDHLDGFVRIVTEALLPATTPWSLGCATDLRRVRRYGCAVLDLPGLDALPTGLLDALAPTLRPVAPPLCLPLAAGVAAAEYPDNGMTFGEHRCHLISLALRRAGAAQDPLSAIAAVFAAHGIDPATPHRTG